LEDDELILSEFEGELGHIAILMI